MERNTVRLYSLTGHYQSVSYLWWQARHDVRSTDLQAGRAARRHSRTRLAVLKQLQDEVTKLLSTCRLQSYLERIDTHDGPIVDPRWTFINMGYVNG
jgi:two-component sensor histidine kinase